VRWLIQGARSWTNRFRALAALAVLLLLVGAFAGLASAERAQYGQLIVWLKGGLSPLQLPREHRVPVSLTINGGLRMSDRSNLPRVVKVEFAVPGQGVISTRGLPRCSPSRLRGADTDTALQACQGALVGHGELDAQIVLPGQAPFWIKAHLLMFNAKPVDGNKVVLMHAYSSVPPIWAVLPFVIRHEGGWLGTRLSATVPGSLGPWPRLARFNLDLSRDYFAGGERRSFMSASCPLPPRANWGPFTLTRVNYTLEDGQQASTAITRGCRAR
jgi:hypothetical protein